MSWMLQAQKIAQRPVVIHAHSFFPRRLLMVLEWWLQKIEEFYRLYTLFFYIYPFTAANYISRVIYREIFIYLFSTLVYKSLYNCADDMLQFVDG